MVVGDSWRYSNDIEETVREVHRQGYTVEYRGSSRFKDCVHALHEKDANGTVTAVLDLSGHEISDCDHFKGWRKLDFPLSIGKKWTFNAEDISQSLGRMCDTRNEMEVIAYEPVKVPAGTFDAFKILHKQQNLCRDTGAWNTRVYWYAPDAKAIVKTTGWNSSHVKSQLVKHTAQSSE